MEGEIMEADKGQGGEGATDEGCSKVMGDRVKKDGGRKQNQLSHTSSSREKRQINSRRIDSPIIRGPQQKA